MLQTYLTFCASIYQFYVRKNDNMPVFYTLCVSSTLISFNILGIHSYMGIFYGYNLPSTYTLAFGVMVVVLLVNYIGFINPGSYKDIMPTRKQNYCTVLFILLSILFICSSSVYYQSHNGS